MSTTPAVPPKPRNTLARKYALPTSSSPVSVHSTPLATRAPLQYSLNRTPMSSHTTLSHRISDRNRSRQSPSSSHYVLHTNSQLNVNYSLLLNSPIQPSLSRTESRLARENDRVTPLPDTNSPKTYLNL